MTKIAIVEDNRIIRESLTEFVQADPECRCVCTCATAEEALKLIPKREPDIVLMDIQLPSLSGIECTAQLKQLLVNECAIDPARFVSVLHYDGMPITARFIADQVQQRVTACKVVPMRRAMP